MYPRLARFIVTYRIPVLAVVALFFIVSLTLAPRIEFNFTPQQIFESTSDDHEYREVFAERFGREDNVVTILISGEDLMRPEVLGPLRDLTYELRLLPGFTDAQSVATMAIPRPDSLSSEPHLGDLASLSGPDGIPRPVRGPPVDPARAEALAAFAMDEPLMVGRLISTTGETALLAAWIDAEIQQVSQLREITALVHQTLDHYEFPDDVALEVRGIPPLRVEIVDSLRKEQLTFVPITAFIFFLILLFLFRRTSGVFLPLGTVVIALVGTLAIMVLTQSSINIINNVLPTLIFVIGISDSIHMLTRQTEEVELGKSHNEAVRTMIRHTGAACLLTTGTTAIGFLSLQAAETSILRAFGWQAAVGVMLAYVGTLFFLSAGLTFLKPARRGRPQADAEHPALLERLLMAMGRRLLQRPWTVVVLSLLFCGAVAFQGHRVVVDTTILEIFGDDHPTAVATRTLERDLGGILPMEISFEADDFDRFKDPELVAAVRYLQEFAAVQDHVRSTESYVDFLQAARVAITGDVDQREALPENREQIEQLLLLISDAPDSRSGIGAFVTGDFRNTRLLLRVEDAGANAALALADELQAEIDRQFQDFDGLRIRITGDAYVASAALNSFMRDLLTSLFIAIFVIFLLMTLVFRSLKIGIISILPNCLPLLITFGFMGIAGINLNTTTIIIFAISLGIAVDDAIHFFARFVEERQRHEDLKEALLHTYFGAGRAILLTSVLLIIGLSVLTFSDFVPTRQFGLLTGITIFSAVIADLVLLPALLYIVYSKFPGKASPAVLTGHDGDPGDPSTT